MTASSYNSFEVDVVEGLSKFHRRFLKGFSSAGQHLVCFSQRFSDHLEALLSRAAIRRMLFCFLLEEHCRDEYPIVACGYVFRAIVGEWHQRKKLVARKARNAFERCCDGRDGFRKDVVLQRFFSRIFHRSNSSYRSPNSKCDRGRGNASFNHGLAILPAVVTRRDVECGDDRSTRTGRDYAIYNDARRVDIHPCWRMWPCSEESRQTAYRERQQRDSSVFDCRAQGIPVLHLSPVLDFRAIVARPAEGT